LFRILRFQVFLTLVQRDLARGHAPLPTGLANLASTESTLRMSGLIKN
jgi:hypothetical protein